MISPHTLRTLDRAHVSAKLQGFVARDIHQLLNRAVHAHLKPGGDVISGKPGYGVTSDGYDVGRTPAAARTLLTPFSNHNHNHLDNHISGNHHFPDNHFPSNHNRPGNQRHGNARPVSGRPGSAGRDIRLTLRDFDGALEDFAPLSLRDVKKPQTSDDVSWDDVGGLADVKAQLIETLLWPVQVRPHISSF